MRKRFRKSLQAVRNKKHISKEKGCTREDNLSNLFINRINNIAFSYYNEVFKDSALSAREKSLIALAVAHAVQCPYCIDAYSNDAYEKGWSEGQMMEAAHVAVAIRGGASLVHSVQMMNKVKEIAM